MLSKIGIGSASLCLLIGAGLLAACGGPDEAVQEPSDPVGAIVGRVTAVSDGSAIPEVEVMVLLTAKSGAREVRAVTDEDGYYSLRNLPGGVAYTVYYRHASYVTRTWVVALPSAAGDYPQGNAIVTQNMTMAAPDASLFGLVFGTEGAPAQGAVVSVDLRPLGFDLVLESVADGDGYYEINGLPGTPAGLTITAVTAPYDEDGDGEPEYDALALQADLYPNAASLLDFDLRTANYPFTLLFSDVDNGMHAAGDDIYVLFNRLVDFDNVVVTLHDNDRIVDLAVEIIPDGGYAFFVATQDGQPLNIGTHYTLNLNVLSVLGLNVNVARGFVATGASATLPAVENLMVTPTDVDWTTTGFNLTWDFTDGAAGYRVYVRDNRWNETFHHVVDVGSSPTPAAAVILPASFDVFTGDAFQTPFAYYGVVDFAVVPLDNLHNPGDLSAAEVYSATDNVRPRITGGLNQTGSADNSTGGGAAEITLDVTFSEYMEDEAFTVTTQGAGVTSTFVLDPDLRHGTFTLTIPAGVDAGGPISITGGSDTSGNPLEDFNGNLFALRELVTNGDFEAGGGSLNNWTLAQTGTSEDPTPIDETGDTVACMGDPVLSQSGTSYLYQNINVPGGVVGNLTLALRWKMTSSAPNGWDYGYCEVSTAGPNVYFFEVDSGDVDANGVWHNENLTTGALGGWTNLLVICVLEHQNGATVSQLCLDDISVIGRAP